MMTWAGMVYALVNGRDEVGYVGQTTQLLSVRRAQHMTTARHGHGRQAAGLREWLCAARRVRAVVLEAEPVDVNEAEAYWIARLRSSGHPVQNVLVGRTGYRPPAEVRADWSMQRTGKPHTRRHQFADPAGQVDSGARGAHQRWHVARQQTKTDCAYCAA